MNIFDSLIKDTEIIGVGALNAQEDWAIITYSFRVFTKSSTINIYSPRFGVAQTAQKDAWLKKYQIVREKISEQIGELQPES